MCFYLSILYIYVVTKKREKQETVVIPAGIAEHPSPGSLFTVELADGHDGGTVARPSAASRPRLFTKGIAY